MPSKYIQDAIIAQIRTFSKDKDLKILEISCGDGETLKRLSDLGYSDLTGTLYGDDQAVFDYSSIDYGKMNIVRNVNLLEKLPFEDKSFDVVFNTELLEHLENHRIALSELARILKPGGRLILETPNIMRLQSRFNFFLTGFHKPRNLFPPYGKPLEEHLYHHSFPVHLPMMDYFLHQFEMRLEKITWNKWRIFPIILFILFYPLIILITPLFLRRQTTLNVSEKWHLFKLNVHPAILI
ncbi:MAG: class I SAM-dependent methyltransferase, partial [Calditrichaeota bacterium]|nr:class I SAM-dependent methyltransferase [Calditrichota bacterium]